MNWVVDLSSSSSESSTESESESDVTNQKRRNVNGAAKEVYFHQKTSAPQPTSASKKSKTQNKKQEDEVHDQDTEMPDANPPSPANPTSASDPHPSTASAPSNAKPKSSPLSTRAVEEEYSALYLRKVTAELGDDLIKVREAQDFKSSSLAMLRHALAQGQSMYAVDEKRRVVGAAAEQAV
ncbi:hypothetical protein DM02DRAFT_521227 [Periconia macrospinosa]|uniref:Ribosome assembly protein 3 n=1 Tax=Periconia macrospinosa TaxID=97972 RepID=A0A2V1DYM2_9PLEO|nr:hypothetical protein DM02DRAFT_521227 [Periconia macrospinosa]